MAPQLVNEIRDLNLSYLLAAQELIRRDCAAAMPRLGVSFEVAEQIAQLSPQQLMRVASRNLVLCSLRFDDHMILGLLAESHRPGGSAPQPPRADQARRAMATAA